MSDRPLPRDKELKPFSSQLRNKATKEENHLWYDFLRKYSVRFNRQRIIGRYIVDFYCARARLVIELDGSQHYEGEAAAYDMERTKYLIRLGLKVMRFTNLDIARNFEGTCNAIDSEVKRRMS
jgi:very-short-patch-repair endonuclease